VHSDLSSKKIRPAGQPDEWRFVQDLQTVNAAIHAHTPTLSNPHTILSQAPPDSKWLSVVDTTNTFFSIPVHPDSQVRFAFTFENKTYTFTHFCQGLFESPTIFYATPSDNLQPLKLPDSSALLTYVDDLLICSPTREDCVADTVALLSHLTDNGQKANLS